MKQLYLDNKGEIVSLLFNRNAKKLYNKIGIPKSKIWLQICDVNDEIISDIIKNFGSDNY